MRVGELSIFPGRQGRRELALPEQELVPGEHRPTLGEQCEILSAGCPGKELLEERISGSHLVCP